MVHFHRWPLCPCQLPSAFIFRSQCWLAGNLYRLCTSFTSPLCQLRNPQGNTLLNQNGPGCLSTHADCESSVQREVLSVFVVEPQSKPQNVYSFGRQAVQEFICSDGMHERWNVHHNPHTVELKPKPWAAWDAYLSAHAHERRCPID